MDFNNNKVNDFKYKKGISTQKLMTDTVSFRSSVTTLTLLVAKEGYKTLTTTKAKAKFANELAANFFNPDTTNSSKQIVTTLFALAKSPAKNEPDGLMYYAFRKDGVQSPSLGYMRSQALKTLFPLVPELSNDINSGHAAKIALLNSLVDTGEYLDSDTFCDAFAALPSIYDDEKIALMKKLLRDNNVLNETYMRKLKEKADIAALEEREIVGGKYPLIAFPAFCIGLLTTPIWKAKYIRENYGKFMPEANKKSAVANIALLSTMEPSKYPALFEDYEKAIQSQASVAFTYIKDLLQKDKGVIDKNRFYHHYASGFTSVFLEDPLNDYERRLAKQYFFDFMSSLKGDKDAIMKEFGLDNNAYYEDLVKDFELVLSTRNIEDVDNLKEIYAKRIAEKKAGRQTYVEGSAKGLIYLSGRERELISLAEDKETVKEETVKEAKKEESPIDSKQNNNTTNYDNCDSGSSLESWEQADLDTPWFVR